MGSTLTSLASETCHDGSFYSYLLFLSPTWSRCWEGCITAAPPRSTLSVMLLLAQGLFLFQRMPLVSWSPDHSLRSIINRKSSPSRQTNCIRLLCLPNHLISTLESTNYIVNPEGRTRYLLLTTVSQCLAQRLTHDRIFVNASQFPGVKGTLLAT